MRLGLTPNLRAVAFVVSPVASTWAMRRSRQVSVRSQAPKSMRIAAISAGPARRSSLLGHEGAITALLLLATTMEDDRVRRAGELLRGERSGRERAVLLEALEAVLPADDAERLLPLLEGDSSRMAARAARLLGSPLPTFEEAARLTERALAKLDVTEAGRVLLSGAIGALLDREH